MEDTTVTYVVAPIVTAIIAGIGWLVKRYFAGRDADKAEMKQDIENLKADVKKTNKKLNDITSIVIGCEHPDCPSRKLLSDYMKKEE